MSWLWRSVSSGTDDGNLGGGGLCDCRRFHERIGDGRWHRERPRLQPNCVQFWAHHQTSPKSTARSAKGRNALLGVTSSRLITLCRTAYRLLLLPLRGTQNPPTFGSWGFDSPSRHQSTTCLCRWPEFRGFLLDEGMRKVLPFARALRCSRCIGSAETRLTCRDGFRFCLSEIITGHRPPRL